MWSTFFVCIPYEQIMGQGLAASSLFGRRSPLQYSCLENPMDGGAWWAAVHGVARSRTRLSNFTFTFHFHSLEKEMATHSSVLAWRIPGMGEPGGLPSLGSHRVGHDWGDLAAAAATLECLVFKGEESTWQCGRPPPGVAQPRLQLHFHFMSLLSLHVIIGWHDWRILNSTLMSINLCLCTYIFHITIQHLF